MKLGLLSDIHEHVAFLRTALDRFRIEQVEQIVVVGDVFQMGRRIDETCRLLADAKAIGVWGNHDFGLSSNPTADTRARYSPAVIEYMTSLRPRLEIDGCLFTHVEPWLNPEVLSDLWYYEGTPDEHGRFDRIFNAAPDRIMFAGHYHKWLLVTPEGVTDWAGHGKAVLAAPQRYFVVLAALYDGHFATFETKTSLLTPYNLASVA